MPVIRLIREHFAREQPLKGLRVAACLHVTTETANLMTTLQAGGAEVTLCASNPLSTQDDVAAALVARYGIPVFAVRGEDDALYYKHIHAVLENKPQVTMDDGADLVATLHKERRDVLADVFGGTEETTTGVIRLRAMAQDGALGYPIIAVNEAMTKHCSTTATARARARSTASRVRRTSSGRARSSSPATAGAGKGVAMRARGLGAKVIVTEVDPIRALEATMDGHQVMTMDEAARIGDIFITLTGDTSVLDRQHFESMKEGAIVATAATSTSRSTSEPSSR